jgi:hypothetical protein
VIRVPRAVRITRGKKEMLVTPVVMNRIYRRICPTERPVPEHLRRPDPGLLCSASSPTLELKLADCTEQRQPALASCGEGLSFSWSRMFLVS